MEKEILRLFKGYLGDKSDSISERGLKYGLLIPDSASEKIIDDAIEMYGKDGAKWNQTFHKDFEIVKNAPIEDLIIQQIMHYITTYGFESLGIYNSNSVYIPKENLDIPDLDVDKIELIAINPLTQEELTSKLMELVLSGIALSKQTVQDIIVLSDFIEKDKFDDIKNREIKTTLYHKYNIMPRNPEEFLRLLVFELTKMTLKIQNKETIKALRNSDKAQALKMLKSYIDASAFGYVYLSSIFLRNKNLFLSLKVKNNEVHIKKDKEIQKEINALINKLRKLAQTNHKPLGANLLDNLTNSNAVVDLEDLKKALDNTTLFREIRILNGILYRLYGREDIVYKIRNGKSYVSTLKPRTSSYVLRLETIKTTIEKHLIDRISDKVKGKTICIPNNVVYAAPTSEKQFVGNIPNGSYVEMPRLNDIVYGVHWNNLPCTKESKSDSWYGEVSSDEERVDLDLKTMNENAMFGWDAKYRSDNGSILFSGDVTNAPLPQGATELFYVGKQFGRGAFLIMLNLYTPNSADIPFEFMVANASANSSEIRKNYMVDPNNIIEKINFKMDKGERQKTLGLITIEDNIKLYFGEFNVGGDSNIYGYSTARINNITKGAYNYLLTYNDLQIKLNDILKDAGAQIVDKPTIDVVNLSLDENGDKVITTTTQPVDIDLSLNSITKDTLINIFGN